MPFAQTAAELNLPVGNASHLKKEWSRLLVTVDYWKSTTKIALFLTSYSLWATYDI